MVLFEFNIGDTKYNYNGKFVNLKKKNFNLLLSLIANKIISKGVDKNGYTPISSKLFKSTYSRYNIYLDYLIYAGKIERDYYIEGKKSFGWRFSEFFKNDIKINSIIYIPNIKKKKHEKKDSSYESIDIDPLILKRLKKDFNSCTIDFNLGQNQIEKKYDEWNNFIDISKWLRNNLLLHKWKKGYKTFCFTNNRLYNNFTSLSGHIRKTNIKLNNESIVELDVPNSFFLMLAVKLKNENPDLIYDYNFQQYCSRVINHTFYSELTVGLNSIRNCRKKGNEDDYSTRLLRKSEVKQLSQVYLNGDNNRQPYLNNLSPSINEFMSMKYPCVHELILATKIGGKSNMYNTLVCIETEFIFSVIKELYEKYDDIKILTCHDSIYVPKSYNDRVQAIWNNKMRELIKGLPIDNYEDDFDLGECSISIFEENDIN